MYRYGGRGRAEALGEPTRGLKKLKKQAAREINNDGRREKPEQRTYLVYASQLGGVIDRPAAARAQRSAGAVAAAETDLTESNGAFAALRVAFHVFGAGLEEFQVLANGHLVFGQLFRIALHSETQARGLA